MEESNDNKPANAGTNDHDKDDDDITMYVTNGILLLRSCNEQMDIMKRAASTVSQCVDTIQGNIEANIRCLQKIHADMPSDYSGQKGKVSSVWTAMQLHMHAYAPHLLSPYVNFTWLRILLRPTKKNMG